MNKYFSLLWIAHFKLLLFFLSRTFSNVLFAYARVLFLFSFSVSLESSTLEAHANGRNKSQHCCVLLGVCGQQCYVRLHGPKSLTGFKLYATSANKCQHCCGSMQTDAACWAQQCCVLLVNNVASVCMRL